MNEFKIENGEVSCKTVWHNRLRYCFTCEKLDMGVICTETETNNHVKVITRFAENHCPLGKWLKESEEAELKKASGGSGCCGKKI